MLNALTHLRDVIDDFVSFRKDEILISNASGEGDIRDLLACFRRFSPVSLRHGPQLYDIGMNRLWRCASLVLLAPFLPKMAHPLLKEKFVRRRLWRSKLKIQLTKNGTFYI